MHILSSPVSHFRRFPFPISISSFLVLPVPIPTSLLRRKRKSGSAQLGSPHNVLHSSSNIAPQSIRTYLYIRTTYVPGTIVLSYATVSYVVVRGSRFGPPFFYREDGSILTKQQFIAGVRAATTAAQVRIADSVIQALGLSRVKHGFSRVHTHSRSQVIKSSNVCYKCHFQLS